MKIIKTLISLPICILLFSCGDTAVGPDMVISSFIEKYPFNYIGLLSDSNAPDTVDVYYSEASGETNVIKHIKVVPPAIVGGQSVNVTYDSIGNKMIEPFHTYIRSKGRRARIDYSKGGSDYMEIVNNGNSDIEYFIVGNQPIKEYDLRNLYAGADGHAAPTNIITDLMPEVFYKKAPVKYLLFPDLKPKEDKYIVNIDGLVGKGNKTYYMYKSTDTVFLKGNQCGEQSVNSAWSIKDVMKLFRAEYNMSNDTILTIAYPVDGYLAKDIRISLGSVKYYEGFKKKTIIPQYHGFIVGHSTLESSERIPFITHVTYPYYQDNTEQ